MLTDDVVLSEKKGNMMRSNKKYDQASGENVEKQGICYPDQGKG